MLTVSLISPGAMGAALGRRLTEHNVRVLTSLEGRGSASAERARDAGMQPVADEALMEASLFLSVVPPGDALGLARRFVPRLAEAVRKPVYVDCNAVNPETVRRMAEAIAPTGAGFVDAGIIGLPPKPHTAGPAIYCSGPGAGAIQVLAEHGLRIREVPGDVGAASALKMSYAGITKGTIAIASAMALGAAHAGMQDALRQEMSESQPELLELLRRIVPDMPAKAWRWVAEMEEIAGFLESVPGGGNLYRAVAELYRHVAENAPGGPDVAAIRTAFTRTAAGKPAADR